MHVCAISTVCSCRLYPATHLLRGLQEDLVLLGYRIPKGVSVCASLLWHVVCVCVCLRVCVLCCVCVCCVCSQYVWCICMCMCEVSLSQLTKWFGIHTCGANGIVVWLSWPQSAITAQDRHMQSVAGYLLQHLSPWLPASTFSHQDHHCGTILCHGQGHPLLQQPGGVQSGQVGQRPQRTPPICVTPFWIWTTSMLWYICTCTCSCIACSAVYTRYSCKCVHSLCFSSICVYRKKAGWTRNVSLACPGNVFVCVNIHN